MAETGLVRTPDQRVRVFVSSALQELAAERRAVRDAITGLRLVPVMFELGARPHPPRNLYRAYLAHSQVFVAAGLARHGDGASYRIGRRPTEFIVGDSDVGTEVPLEDGLVWAALHQDAIVVQLPDRSGPLAGQPVAALLRRG